MFDFNNNVKLGNLVSLGKRSLCTVEIRFILIYEGKYVRFDKFEFLQWCNFVRFK